MPVKNHTLCTVQCSAVVNQISGISFEGQQHNLGESILCSMNVDLLVKINLMSMFQWEKWTNNANKVGLMHKYLAETLVG